MTDLYGQRLIDVIRTQNVENDYSNTRGAKCEQQQASNMKPHLGPKPALRLLGHFRHFSGPFLEVTQRSIFLQLESVFICCNSLLGSAG